MSEKLSNSSVLESSKEEQENLKPRFEGTPIDVPIYKIEVALTDSEKDQVWKPGVTDSNNGLSAAHDKDRPVVYIVESSDAAIFSGYEHGDAFVPLTGGDQRGWYKGPKSRELAQLRANAAARRSGVKGREVKQIISGKEYDVKTLNPFDEGDFLDMTNVVEVSPGGSETMNSDIVTQESNGELKSDMNEVIGRMCSNNGTLAWVTPEGRVQIAPYSQERVSRLQELGYKQGDIFVPHSNGEQFKNTKDEQRFAEITFADMKRRGEKMTMQERQSRFGRVIVPVAFTDLIKF